MDNTAIPVESGSRLRVTFSVHPAANPVNSSVVVLHHGILHSRESFLPLIAALNAQGMHAVMIDQQSEQAGLFRNFIGLGAYTQGMRDALGAIQEHLDTAHKGMRIGIFACHSMGAEIAEETLQKNPALRRPMVLLAPIPVAGAFPVFCRILGRHPFALLKAILMLSVHSLAKTPQRVRELFFDEHTPQEIVARTTAHLKHSPFWSYVQLTFRWLLRPRIVADEMPKLLLFSKTDFIFKPQEFAGTRKLYQEHLEEIEMPGGHDFLIEYAELAATAISKFFAQHAAMRIDPAQGETVPHPAEKIGVDA